MLYGNKVEKKEIYLPDFEKWPAPSSHLNNSWLLSVFVSLNFATNFAGSEYKTRGSIQQRDKKSTIRYVLNHMLKEEYCCYLHWTCAAILGINYFPKLNFNSFNNQKVSSWLITFSFNRNPVDLLSFSTAFFLIIREK